MISKTLLIEIFKVICLYIGCYTFFIIYSGGLIGLFKFENHEQLIMEKQTIINKYIGFVTIVITAVIEIYSVFGK